MRRLGGTGVCRFSLLEHGSSFSDAASGGNDVTSNGWRLHYSRPFSSGSVCTRQWKTLFHITL